MRVTEAEIRRDSENGVEAWARSVPIGENWRPMVGKRVQFNDETWEAIEAVMRDSGSSFQDLTDEAFADLLKKHKQPVGLMASLKESVGAPRRTTNKKPR